VKVAEREILALIAKANPVPYLDGLLDRDEAAPLGPHAPELRRTIVTETTTTDRPLRPKTQRTRIGRRLLPAVLLLVLVLGGAIGFLQSIGGDQRAIVYGLGVEDDLGEIYTITPIGNRPRKVLPDPIDCADCTQWSPDGRRLLITVRVDDRTAIATVDPDGSDYTVLSTSAPTLNLAAGVWAPDGARFAAIGWDDSDPSRPGVYTASSIDGGDLLRVTVAPAGQEDIPLAFSPDGLRILFLRDEAGDNSGPLFAVNVDGTGLVQLSPVGVRARWVFGPPATWSPDGTKVSFAASWTKVFVVAADGTGLQEIATGQLTSAARWSPTGEWIVFDKVTGSHGVHDLFLIHPDGSGLTQLTSTPEGECCAVWSPDGMQLLFQSVPVEEITTNRSVLFVINSDGTGRRQLTTEPGGYTGYTWRP
jgi:dipeptidyl aminopeptidase/acylaminoacyl peptidase